MKWNQKSQTNASCSIIISYHNFKDVAIGSISVKQYVSSGDNHKHCQNKLMHRANWHGPKTSCFLYLHDCLFSQCLLSVRYKCQALSCFFSCCIPIFFVERSFKLPLFFLSNSVRLFLLVVIRLWPNPSHSLC